MIKNFFYPGSYSNNIDFVLLLLRLVIGAFMLTHGVGKCASLSGEASIQFPDPLGVGADVSLALAVFSEVLCSILLILGLGTRLAAIPLLITMLIAAFVIHSADGFGKQELPLLYATIYFIIGVAGAGKISIDNIIYTRIKTH